jgi:DNA-binding CsgD family transcriptional regulator
MFLLPARLREMFERRRPGILRRVFSKEEQLRRAVREMAVSQQRAEQDVYDDIIESGMAALRSKRKYEAVWISLSDREREVTALTCMGYTSHEMAGALGIAYETVRTHSKHVYAKFGLSRKRLQAELSGWNFDAWWANRQA